ncbi:hypothetical protein PAMP_008410 [Pampus punctatissimus]
MEQVFSSASPQLVIPADFALSVDCGLKQLCVDRTLAPPAVTKAALPSSFGQTLGTGRIKRRLIDGLFGLQRRRIVVWLRDEVRGHSGERPRQKADHNRRLIIMHCYWAPAGTPPSLSPASHTENSRPPTFIIYESSFPAASAGLSVCVEDYVLTVEYLCSSRLVSVFLDSDCPRGSVSRQSSVFSNKDSLCVRVTRKSRRAAAQICCLIMIVSNPGGQSMHVCHKQDGAIY